MTRAENLLILGTADKVTKRVGGGVPLPVSLSRPAALAGGRVVREPALGLRLVSVRF